MIEWRFKDNTCPFDTSKVNDWGKHNSIYGPPSAAEFTYYLFRIDGIVFTEKTPEFDKAYSQFMMWQELNKG